MTYERNWILSEKNARIFPTKLCQIFYDVGILSFRDDRADFKLLCKENINLSEIKSLLDESQKVDLAVCFSSFILSPQVPFKSDEKSDAIIGLIIYDLKNRQPLSLNLNTLTQFQMRTKKVKPNGLWEYVYDLFARTSSHNSFKSYLPLPLSIRDYTPLPWFCLAFMKGVTKEVTIDDIKLDLPLFLVFGTPLLLAGKPSYSFDSEKQTAFVMLGFREGSKQSLHQVRFDMSKGEPKLHLDYQIFCEEERPRKTLGHFIINFQDIWDFSENLAIGFLLAAVYDLKFDTTVVSQKLEGIDESFRNDPLTVYPLFVRSMAKEPFNRIKGSGELLEILEKIAKGNSVKDDANLKELEKLHLVSGGQLTILGDVVYRRVLQQKNRK